MAIPIDGGKKLLQIDTGFTIEVIIGENDYESDVQSMQIVSSFNGSYPIFMFKMNIKPIEMIQNKILGHEIIQLSIHLKEENGVDKVDVFSVDLLFLSGDYDIPISNQLLGSGKTDSLHDQRPYTIKAIPEHAYRMMTFNINRIYKNQHIQQIMIDLLLFAKDEIDKEGIDTSFQLKYDYRGANTINIDQIILPPTVLKNHCDYLLNEFGLYDGFGIFYASIGIPDENLGDKVINYNLMNITDRLLHDKATFNIIHLANDDADNAKYINNFDEGNFKDYFIYSDISTKYMANTAFSALGVDNHYIQKPVDKFHRIDNVNMENYISKNIYFNSESDPYISESIRKRNIYISDHICHNKDIDNHPQKELSGEMGAIQDEYWLSAKLNKSTFNMSQISVNVERLFPLHLFMNIGQPVKFESKTSDYDDINGKYILFSSNIILRRDNAGWKSTAKLRLVRPTWGKIL